VDQTENWSHGIQTVWAYTPDAVAEATVDTLVLSPKK
jgi:hypothetical protein